MPGPGSGSPTSMATMAVAGRPESGPAGHPHQGPRLSAAMVSVYGFTQMAGPWLTKQWLEAGGTLTTAFGIGVVALALGAVFAFFVPLPGGGWQD